MTRHDADDMIASLMQEMGRRQQQGYSSGANASASEKQQDTKGSSSSSSSTTPSATKEDTSPLHKAPPPPPPPPPPRILPELPDYPNPTFAALGSHSIWNPLVPGGCGCVGIGSDTTCSINDNHQIMPSTQQQQLPTQHFLLLLPTNPQVEVARRRVFETFRKACHELIEQVLFLCVSTNTNNNVAGNSSSSWVRRLPIPAILEKWHMDAKLHEKQQLMKQWRKNEEHSNIAAVVNATLPSSSSYDTVDILKQLRRSRLQQQGLLRLPLPVYDPVLLSKEAPSLFAPILRTEVQKTWQQYNGNNNSNSNNNNTQSQAAALPPKFHKRAQRIQKGLYRLVCEALESFDKQLAMVARQQQQANRSSSNDGGRKSSRRRPKIIQQQQSFNDDTDASMATVSFNGVVLKLHGVCLEKLQRLYDRTIQRRANDGNTTIPLSFEEALFCLLCRYDMIQGAGLQAGVPGNVMDCLLTEFNCRIECFASPLNCRYDRFCSAFPDVDLAFGSYGSFFEWIRDQESRASGDAVESSEHDDDKKESNDIDHEGVCYQANPPFCEGLISELNTTIASVLSDSDAPNNNQRPIMFVVFVPAWRDAACYQSLLENDFLTHHELLKQGDHWYAEGTRHRRKDSFRVASFDTSILFYQNQAAKNKWNLQSSDSERDTLTAIEDLRKAFCQDPCNEDAEKVQRAMLRKPAKQTKPTPTSAPLEKPSTNKSKGSKTIAKPKLNKKKDKKRKWNEQSEGKAQLDLLQSLGLASDGDNDGTGKKSKNAPDSKEAGVLEFNSKKSKKKKRKKNKK